METYFVKLDGDRYCIMLSSFKRLISLGTKMLKRRKKMTSLGSTEMIHVRPLLMLELKLI